MNIWSVILSPDFLFTSIRVMTPILFAAMACMVFVKGGIDPIGTEGIMLSCALAGPVGGYFTHSALGGVIFAMAVGVVLALVAPGAGWVAEFGNLFVGALKGIACLDTLR